MLPICSALKDFFSGSLSSLVLGRRFKLVVGTKMDFEPWSANEVFEARLYFFHLEKQWGTY